MNNNNNNNKKYKKASKIYFEFQNIYWNYKKICNFFSKISSYEKIILLDIEAFWWEDSKKVQSSDDFRIPFLIGKQNIVLSDGVLKLGVYKSFSFYKNITKSNVMENEEKLKNDFFEDINFDEKCAYIYLGGRMEKNFLKNLNNKKNVWCKDLYEVLDDAKLEKTQLLKNRDILTFGRRKMNIDGKDVRIMAMNDILHNTSKHLENIIKYNEMELRNAANFIVSMHKKINQNFKKILVQFIDNNI
ncbi:hypothetical protein SCHIN_v1c07730 [Spiroplasma chinense]|uniref:YprB ribonuclease H-like domain-containing protein n=1 Tax=Spiroplasma chinense TaxID=216932 RepID=A0A5B9Y474_9MOLU|nr:ribonuclease H-like domain-containing protein [Spiroplasma chinense]QEH61968.1 hypothetical protein SCHIN_v1c07730 [Spiroplasma chinense]